MSGGITSTHPKLLLQSCCNILADSVTGDRNPKGWEIELVVDNIPGVVKDAWFTSNFNLNESG